MKYYNYICVLNNLNMRTKITSQTFSHRFNQVNATLIVEGETISGYSRDPDIIDKLEREGEYLQGLCELYEDVLKGQDYDCDYVEYQIENGEAVFYIVS